MVTPHSRSSCWIVQSSADGPRSPTMPGWTTRQTCFAQIDSGIARFRKGATIRSGANSATASALTASPISNSTLSSCPTSANSQYTRCVRLLKLCVSNRMRIG